MKKAIMIIASISLSTSVVVLVVSFLKHVDLLQKIQTAILNTISL